MFDIVLYEIDNKLDIIPCKQTDLIFSCFYNHNDDNLLFFHNKCKCFGNLYYR